MSKTNQMSLTACEAFQTDYYKKPQNPKTQKLRVLREFLNVARLGLFLNVFQREGGGYGNDCHFSACCAL